MNKKEDIIEYIYKKNGEVLSKIIYEKNYAEELLGSLTADIRLDLHGVCDLFDEKESIFEQKECPKCIVSFIGRNSDKRQSTVDKIKERVSNGQIDFGILSFARGNKKIESGNTFCDVGSKAWINKLINHNGKAIFIDDNIDHINSVNSLKIDGLLSVLFDSNKKSQLVKIIMEFFI